MENIVVNWQIKNIHYTHMYIFAMLTQSAASFSGSGEEKDVSVANTKLKILLSHRYLTFA